METLEYCQWHIEFDREATATACVAKKSGGADTCRCSVCKNFSLEKPVGHPSEFLALLDRLGIDPNCEIEVYSHEENPDYVDYCGCFYFVGQVEGEGMRALPDAGAFAYYPCNGRAYHMPAFEGVSVSRVEFCSLRLSWKLATEVGPARPVS